MRAVIARAVPWCLACLVAACGPGRAAPAQPPTTPDPADPAPATRPEPSGGALQIVDATAAYFAFWDRHADDPLEVQVEGFIAEVVPAHPELYTAEVLGLQGDDYDEALAARLREILPRSRDELDDIRATHADLQSQLARYQASFTQAFPDFEPDAPVYLMGAIGSFDGATRMVDGRSSLMFGVDGITLFHAEGADPAAFFHHELFHVYHRQVLEAGGVDMDSERNRNMAMALWGEGLAVYVSGELNPGSTPEELLLTPEMIEQTDARRQELTAELLEHLRSGDERLYASYFLGANGGRVPKRCGYYLGMQIAARVRGDRKLAALARLSGDALVDEIADALREIGTAPKPASTPGN